MAPTIPQPFAGGGCSHCPSPAAHSRDELDVVVRVLPHQVLCPPGQEVVQRDAGVGADLDLVPVVPDIQAHQDHAELEFLIKLQEDRILRVRGLLPPPRLCHPHLPPGVSSSLTTRVLSGWVTSRMGLCCLGSWKPLLGEDPLGDPLG